LARKPGRLKGSEIRFLRKNLGIPAKKIARILGLAAETYSRVENEKNPGLSGAAEKLFRLMASDAPGRGGVREAILGLAENLEREDRRTARTRAVSTSGWSPPGMEGGCRVTRGRRPGVTPGRAGASAAASGAEGPRRGRYRKIEWPIVSIGARTRKSAR